MKMRLISPVLLTLLLGACGGGGGGGAPNLNSAQIRDAQTALFNRLDGTGLAATNAMPARSQARFQGTTAWYDSRLDLDLSDADDLERIQTASQLFSEVTMDVNFRAETLEGRLHNFRTTDNRPLTGTVPITNSGIDLPLAAADFEGDLRLGGDRMRVEGTFIGGFFGPNAEAFVGGGQLTQTGSSRLPSEMQGLIMAE